MTLLLFAVLWSMALAYGSFVPFEFASPGEEWAPRWQRLISLSPHAFHFGDVLLNFCMTPIEVFLWTSILSQFSGFGNRRLRDAAIVMLVCAGFSVAIEFVQIWIPARSPSSADILAQWIGVLVGGFAWWIWGPSFVDWIGNWENQGHDSDVPQRVLKVYALGYLVFHFLPTGLSVRPTDVYRNMRTLEDAISWRQDLFSWRAALPLALSLLISIPLGAYLARRKRSVSKPIGALLESLLVLGLISLAIELFQLLRANSSFDVSTIAARWIGGSLGGVATMLLWRQKVPSKNLPNSSPLFWASVATLYAIVLAAVSWSPFELTSDWELLRQRRDSFFRLPFVAAFRDQPWNALGNLAVKSALFAGLGLFLAQFVRALRPIPRLKTLFILLAWLAGTAFGFGIELVQIAIPGRVPDLGDVLNYSFSVLAALLLLSGGKHSANPDANCRDTGTIPAESKQAIRAERDQH